MLKPVALPADWLEAPCRETVVERALGMVTAADVRCACDVPNYTAALRDGWAVRSTDDPELRHAADWRVENGASWGAMRADEAVWVNTGGRLPIGADAVIASRGKEDEAEAQEVFRRSVAAGDNVKTQGSDWRAGELILPRGTRIGARELALLFEAGVERVAGWTRPRVSVVATGSEMVERTEDLSAGFRRCSNASYIAALMARIGVEEICTQVVPDDVETLAETLCALDAESDVVITVGGTGRGKRDYTRAAVLAAGGRFVGRDTQTDSPFVAARLAHSALIGLPGNPLAVMMIAQCVLLERVRAVFHLPEAPVETVDALISADIEAGHCGELCVALERDAAENLIARPIVKGTGGVRVFRTAAGFVHLSGRGLRSGEPVAVMRFRN